MAINNKIAFILPCVGKRAGETYPRSWLMEPLAIAQLSALTPAGWEKVFHDDRLEPIPYDEPTGLAAISVETYSARRAYQIAAQYRRRGVKVVMGGFHPTLAPDDAAQHADSIVVGEAEEIWPRLLEDFAQGKLKPRYQSAKRPDLKGIFPDRTIFNGKRYMNLTLVETGRGCPFGCDFCSITAFFNHSYSARPVEDVVAEIAGTGRKNFFFVDDNMAIGRTRALELFRALEPLRIRWVGQIGAQVADDDEFLAAMRRCGCVGVLVGFESLNTASSALAAKRLGGNVTQIYANAIANFTRHRLAVYGTFVFGYEGDSRATIRETVDFASEQRLFFAAFNHLVPFPGTPLHQRLCEEKRMLRDDWWLSSEYRFGDVAFRPDGFAPDELSDACFEARKSFYTWPRILKRATNLRSNCTDPFRAAIYFSSNLMSGRDAEKRQGMPLGAEE